MKIINLLTTAIIILPVSTFADYTCEPRTGCSTGGLSYGSTDYCTAGQTTECYYITGPATQGYINKCTACVPARTLTQEKPGDCTNITATRCTCTNGCTDVTWTTSGMATGYEYSIQCGSTCDTSRKYRCAADYYGTTTNGTTGCQHKDNCISDTVYKSFGSTGYERKITRGYNSTSRTCVDRVVSYRCAPNYYGTSTNGTSGCTQCPGSEAGGLGAGETNGTSNAGTTSITGCYMPKDVEICDGTGCFDLMSDCYWTN